MKAVVVGGLVAGVRGADKVFITRHCVRSMYPTLRGRADPSFDHADNYTALPFPTNDEWHSDGIATCTARGQQLAQVFGESLSEHLPRPISIVADNSARCIDTAQRVALGLGEGVSYDGTVLSLDPVKWGVCSQLSGDDLEVGVQSMLDEVEAGLGPFAAAWAQRHEFMARLQDLVGKGEAPNITEIPDTISDGVYVGGLHASSQAMVENFILEAGAGMPVAWGALDGVHREELWRDFMPLNILYNAINHRGLPLATRNGPVIMSILQQLKDPTTGTNILLGHDTNLDAIATILGMTWSCGPFADNASPPHIGLLFERDPSSSRVMVRSVCTAFDDDDTAGKVIFGTVSKTSLDMNGLVEIEDLESEAKMNLDKWGGLDCVVPVPEAAVV